MLLDANLCLRVWFLRTPTYTMCIPKCTFACIHAKNMNVLKIFQISLKIGQYSLEISFLGRKSIIVLPVDSHSLRTVFQWPASSVSSRDMLKYKDSGPAPPSLNQNLQEGDPAICVEITSLDDFYTCASLKIIANIGY